MKAYTTIVIALVMVIQTGCTLNKNNDGEFGASMFAAQPVDFEMRGTVAGLQAYSDTVNGLITNGKASNDAADTPYYENRRKQEAEVTTRTLKDRLVDAWNKAQQKQVVGANQGATAPASSN